MTFSGTNNPPINHDALAHLEGRLGGVLPQEYRDFITKYNGDRPAPNWFHIPDCNDDSLVDHFLGFGREGEDLLYWLNELDDLHGKFIPIGFDPGGNALILDYSDGRIYYWDSARHFDCSTDDENAFLVATSFDGFLKKLFDGN